GKSPIRDYQEMLVRAVVFCLAQNQRSSTTFMANQLVERVALANEKERSASGLGQLAHSRFFAHVAPGRKWQPFDHQGVKIIFQDDVFEVTVQLRDRRIRAADRPKLTSVLSHKCFIERRHLGIVWGGRNSCGSPEEQAKTILAF